MERRRYRNPPIEEALCEFRFAPGPEWNLTVPGRFYELVKGSYPGVPRHQNLMEMEAGVESGPELSSASIKVRQGLARVQIPTLDGKRLLGVGPDVLSIHMLRPYTEWEEFRVRISEALQAYLQVAAPEGVVRIGLRYVNRITVLGDAIELGDLFTAPPRQPEGFPTAMAAFLSRTESVYDDIPVRLILTLASVKAPEGQAAVLADFDLIWQSSDEPMPPERAMQMVDDLRNRERDAFEALITDKARELFDAE